MAVSDALGITAQGLPTLKRTTVRDDLGAIDRIAGQQEAVLILIGNPLHMDGTESRQSAYTRQFGDKLAARTGRPVEYWDERLTSVAAEEVLKQSGVGIGKRARAVDKMAAQIILRNYLTACATMAEFGVPLESWEMDPEEIDSWETDPDEDHLDDSTIETERAR